MSAEHGGKHPDKREVPKAPGKQTDSGGDRRTGVPQTVEIYTKEVPEPRPRRPRAAIQEDLETTQAKMEACEDQLNAYEDRFRQLPEQQQAQIGDLFNLLESGEEIDETKIQELDSASARDLFTDTRPIVERTLVLQKEEEAIKHEALPYIKEDTEEAAINLLTKIDYDAVFDYYGEVAKGVRKNEDSTDFLERAVGEMYFIRKLGYEARTTEEDKDYDYFEGAQRQIKEAETLWSTRGFLKEQPEEVDEQDILEADASAKQKREHLMQEVTLADKQLRRYGELLQTYRPGVMQHTEHVDNELWHLKSMFNVSSWNDYYRENFDEIDFDPRLLDAAKRYIDAKLDAHRRAGRLPKTDAILAEENQERYHRTDLETAYDHIEFNGFEPPEGMVSIFDQQAFIEHAKKTFPPDFVDGLESISYIPDYVQDPDSPYDIDGRMIPIFGEGEQWDTIISRKIELYTSPFIPETTDALEKFIAASFYRDTPNHEIMHNAHNLADYDEMEAWEKVMESDPTAIDPYVKRSRAIGEQKGKFEDYAVSGEFYTEKPLILFCISEKRYRHMDWFFKRHLPYQQQAAFDRERDSKMYASLSALQKQYPDKSFDEIKEEVRKVYLAHEQEE